MMEVVDWRDDAHWDAFVLNASDSSYAHLSQWRAILSDSYGVRGSYLAAVENGTIRGILPLALVRSHLLGNCLVSMPFMDYGGVCCNGDEQAESVLVQAAQAMAPSHGAVLSLRYLHDHRLTLPSWNDKVSMFLDLDGSEEVLWKRLPSERRNRIRKGRQCGLQASVHGVEGLSDFYSVLAGNMRDVGSPVHSRRFFHQIMKHLNDHARILLVRLGEQSIGAALMLSYKGILSIPWVSSSRAFFEKYPNQILYWEAIRYASANGCVALDFGRCSYGSGTYEAKRQWGAKPVRLHWYYYPETTRPPGGDVDRYGWFTDIWKRLPLPVANVIGPWLRPGIPN
jgi:FemAB-related protein (PEP-CTERM system-associated)